MNEDYSSAATAVSECLWSLKWNELVCRDDFVNSSIKDLNRGKGRADFTPPPL